MKKIFEILIKLYAITFYKSFSYENQKRNGKTYRITKDGKFFYGTLTGIAFALIVFLVGYILEFFIALFSFFLNFIPFLKDLLEFFKLCIFGIGYILLFLGAIHFLLNFRKKLYWKYKVLSVEEVNEVSTGEMSNGEWRKLKREVSNLKGNLARYKREKQEEADNMARQRAYEAEQERIAKQEEMYQKTKNGETINLWDYKNY
ncbi:hypothetical protein [Fusobacterium animalis]|jgi:hypothetical protein|uniref:Uncharacterized protein n=1 Tax=Fusobacterium animalis TaxID=76859 RepID=A0A2B7YQG4_9FUSO|nr:hypothetical protein [Fusobacterium animalis]PGH23301.1 hypothetical protein RN90_12970 [Fusobacterium animalis]